MGERMELIEKAPAKINLGLDVLYKRPDEYHELEMVMSSVDLADHLFFEEIPEDRIIVETNKAFLPVDQRNNVYQAATLLKNKYHIKKGVKIFVKKYSSCSWTGWGQHRLCSCTERDQSTMESRLFSGRIS